MKVKFEHPVFWICMGLLALSGCKNSILGEADSSRVSRIDGTYPLEQADRLYDEDQKPAALALYTRSANDARPSTSSATCCY